MAIRDKLRANAQPTLQPGENIQVVFAAQSANPLLSILSYWIIIFKNAYRVVIVTDRRIIVCKSGRMSMTKVNEITGEFPRATLIGPPAGLWYKCESLGESLYVHKRFHKDITEADAGAAAAVAAPPPPPPSV